MTVNWKRSVILGIIAFGFTLIFSYMNNTWTMSLFCSGLGFLIFFALGSILQLLCDPFFSATKTKREPEQTSMDMSNPQSEQNNQVEEPSMKESEFQTIQLTSLHSEVEMLDSKQIANTINAWTEQDREG